jgi:hypothetical protein
MAFLGRYGLMVCAAAAVGSAAAAMITKTMHALMVLDIGKLLRKGIM